MVASRAQSLRYAALRWGVRSFRFFRGKKIYNSVRLRGGVCVARFNGAQLRRIRKPRAPRHFVGWGTHGLLPGLRDFRVSGALFVV